VLASGQVLIAAFGRVRKFKRLKRVQLFLVFFIELFILRTLIFL